MYTVQRIIIMCCMCMYVHDSDVVSFTGAVCDELTCVHGALSLHHHTHLCSVYTL